MRTPWILIGLLAFAGPLVAQEGASLAEVEALAAQGRILEARETLENWWMGRFPSASRMDRQRGIWLRGKLTVDPSMAEMDFRRLVLEFPGGPFSDDALVRLALSSDLRGDLREAEASFQKLIRDYPSSPRIPEAQAWIAAHADAIAALPPVEESTPPATEGDLSAEISGTEEGRREGGEFSVQLGAFRSLDRALALAVQLRDMGYVPRVVRTSGNDLARVRIGRFSTRNEAEALAHELENRDLEVSLVTDAGSEERVGGEPFSVRSLLPV